jgi:BASS family bile acid:Na+ symporter
MTIRSRDTLLVVVIFSSIGAAVVFPDFGELFAAFPLYSMMALLFMSFLTIPLDQIRQAIQSSSGYICLLLLVKLIALPTAMFFVFRWFLPSHALAALLLSGISTAVVSPFFAGMLEANSPLVIVMVVASSLLVPITLPALVKVLSGHEMAISFSAMTRLLCAVVFIPFVLAQLSKRYAEKLASKLAGKQYPISLVLMSSINLGIFSKYSHYLRRDAATLATALGVATLLAAIYFATGVLLSWNRSLADQVSAILSLTLLNNTLVVVFSSQFFGPIEPIVNTVYMVPFFSLIIPLRAYQRSRRLRVSAACNK